MRVPMGTRELLNEAGDVRCLYLFAGRATAIQDEKQKEGVVQIESEYFRF
jgi:hypothetical protein